MAILSPYLPVITLSVNGLNSLIKKWILTKQNPTICFIPGAQFRSKDTNRLKVKG